MGALAAATAEGLPLPCVRLHTAVASVEPHVVHLASGETVVAKEVVVAVDAGAADRLWQRAARPFHGTHCAYFAAPRSLAPPGA